VTALGERPMMETIMFCKLRLVAVAAVAWGAALAPTAAAAWYDSDHTGWGPRVYLGAPVSYGYGSCYVRELLRTPWGPRWRLVNRCT
jgi:hypothetical protein